MDITFFIHFVLIYPFHRLFSLLFSIRVIEMWLIDGGCLPPGGDDVQRRDLKVLSCSAGNCANWGRPAKKRARHRHRVRQQFGERPLQRSGHHAAFSSGLSPIEPRAEKEEHRGGFAFFQAFMKWRSKRQRKRIKVVACRMWREWRPLQHCSWR